MDFISIDFETDNEKRHSPCALGITVIIISNKKHNTTPQPILSYSTNFFKDKVVVFTGPLSSMARTKASTIIYNLGGTVGSSVTKKTNILIIGVKNIQSLAFNQMSSKLRRAIELDSNGQDIEFLHEEEFLNILNQK